MFQMKSILKNVIPKDVIQYVILKYSQYLKFERKFKLDINEKIDNIWNLIYDNINKLAYVHLVCLNYNKSIKCVYNLSENKLKLVSLKNDLPSRLTNHVNIRDNIVNILPINKNEPPKIVISKNWLLNIYENKKVDNKFIELHLPKIEINNVSITPTTLYILDRNTNDIYIYSIIDHTYKIIKNCISKTIPFYHIIMLKHSANYLYLYRIGKMYVYSLKTLNKINEYTFNNGYTKLIKDDILYLFNPSKQNIQIYNAITFEKLERINLKFRIVYLSNNRIFCTSKDFKTIRIYF